MWTQLSELNWTVAVIYVLENTFSVLWHVAIGMWTYCCVTAISFWFCFIVQKSGPNNQQCISKHYTMTYDVLLPIRLQQDKHCLAFHSLAFYSEGPFQRANGESVWTIQCLKVSKTLTLNNFFLCLDTLYLNTFGIQPAVFYQRNSVVSLTREYGGHPKLLI